MAATFSHESDLIQISKPDPRPKIPAMEEKSSDEGTDTGAKGWEKAREKREGGTIPPSPASLHPGFIAGMSKLMNPLVGPLLTDMYQISMRCASLSPTH